MKKLAIFDIDYTITRKETLMELFKYTISKDKRNLRFLPRAAFCGLMYIMHVYDEKKVKEKFLKFIDGIKEEDLSILVKNFYKDRLQNIVSNKGRIHVIKAHGTSTVTGHIWAIKQTLTDLKKYTFAVIH